MRFFCWTLLAAAFSIADHGYAADRLPTEPIDIGRDPQFVFDNDVVDNSWALRYKREAVTRVYHQPKKHAANPVIAGEGGFLTVDRDDESGKFRLWYQTWIAGDPAPPGKYAISYAESDDGLNWVLPKLGLHDWKGTKENNVVWRGQRGRRASSPFLLETPPQERRGFRYLFLYRETDGIRVIGSHDGIHWDGESDTRILHLHSDTQNAVVYDSRRGEYVMFCRPKHIYRTFQGDVIDTGASRRIARLSSPSLWDEWTGEPQTMFIPDELDTRNGFNFFYGMPTRYYAGVYWGFVEPFKINTDIHTELAVSRDGINFSRHPDRPKLIERGPDGAWDDGMVFGALPWVEVGDEWWIYYAGWDGPHGIQGRTPGIGLATLRKEGFISMRGPTRGGVVATRKIRWPGGDLVVNCDAHEGVLKVRLSDERRKPLAGFDYDDCAAFSGDEVAHKVTWREANIDSLAGQVIRIEFYLENADLFTFRAAAE